MNIHYASAEDAEEAVEFFGEEAVVLEPAEGEQVEGDAEGEERTGARRGLAGFVAQLGEVAADRPVHRRRADKEEDELGLPEGVEEPACEDEEDPPAEVPRPDEPCDGKHAHEEDGEIDCREEHRCLWPPPAPRSRRARGHCRLRLAHGRTFVMGRLRPQRRTAATAARASRWPPAGVKWMPSLARRTCGTPFSSGRTSA